MATGLCGRKCNVGVGLKRLVVKVFSYERVVLGQQPEKRDLDVFEAIDRRNPLIVVYAIAIAKARRYDDVIDVCDGHSTLPLQFCDRLRDINPSFLSHLLPHHVLVVKHDLPDLAAKIVLVEVATIARHLLLCIDTVDWRANSHGGLHEAETRNRSSQDDSTHRNAKSEDASLTTLTVDSVNVSGRLAKVFIRASSVHRWRLEHQLVAAGVCSSRSIADYNDTEPDICETTDEVADPGTVF